MIDEQVGSQGKYKIHILNIQTDVTSHKALREIIKREARDDVDGAVADFCKEPRGCEEGRAKLLASYPMNKEGLYYLNNYYFAPDKVGEVWIADLRGGPDYNPKR